MQYLVNSYAQILCYMHNVLSRGGELSYLTNTKGAKCVGVPSQRLVLSEYLGIS